jgi:hypothetical protein
MHTALPRPQSVGIRPAVGGRLAVPAFLLVPTRASPTPTPLGSSRRRRSGHGRAPLSWLVRRYRRIEASTGSGAGGAGKLLGFVAIMLHNKSVWVIHD